MRSVADSLIVVLEAPEDFAGFRQSARVLLALGVEPDAVHWRREDARTTQHASEDLFAGDATDTAAGRALTPQLLEQVPLPPAAPVRIGKKQLALLRSACCHRNPGRFALCYRWLWRVQQSPALARDALDPDWREIERLAYPVRREIHKMHAFVRFRPTQTAEGETVHIAWFEPDHYIVPAAADFFVRRFTNMRWAILTPDSSAHWDLAQLHLTAGSTASAAPDPDAGEALWLAYYQSTFNPARLKVQAMRREMPERYWKNLPEARTISQLIASAGQNTQQMLRLSARAK